MIEEAETSHDLAAHGAMLLQTALSDKNANQQNADGTVRKPLTDIGNNLVSIIHMLFNRVSFGNCDIEFSAIFSIHILSFFFFTFQGLSSVPKPNNMRKKWRKSAAIQLVPATPPVSVSRPLETEVPEQSKANGEVDIPLKLPRAMRSTLTNNNQLKQRNTDQSNEPVDNDVCTSSLGSPHQQAKS